MAGLCGCDDCVRRRELNSGYPEQRARALLDSLLSHEQRLELADKSHITIRIPGDDTTFYEIGLNPESYQTWAQRCVGTRVTSLCVMPVDSRGIPPSDKLLTLFVWISGDTAAFNNAANDLDWWWR